MTPRAAVGLNVIREILNARSPDDIARYFTFPMPAQSGADLHVYQSAQDLADGYSQLAKAKRNLGQTDFHCRIAAVELPRNSRFRVWVDWLYTDQDGNPRSGDRSIYFCSTWHGQIAVEMIQCAPQIETAPQHRLRAFA